MKTLISAAGLLSMKLAASGLGLAWRSRASRSLNTTAPTSPFGSSGPTSRSPRISRFGTICNPNAAKQARLGSRTCASGGASPAATCRCPLTASAARRGPPAATRCCLSPRSLRSASWLLVRTRLVVEAAREVGGREIVRVPFQWPVKGSAQAAGEHELGAVTVSVNP